MEAIIAELIKMFPKINTYLMAGTFVFARLIGFFRFAPIFNRKDFPSLVKLPLALIITVFMVPFLHPEKCLTQCDSFMLTILDSSSPGFTFYPVRSLDNYLYLSTQSSLQVPHFHPWSCLSAGRDFYTYQSCLSSMRRPIPPDCLHWHSRSPTTLQLHLRLSCL